MFSITFPLLITIIGGLTVNFQQRLWASDISLIYFNQILALQHMNQEKERELRFQQSAAHFELIFKTLPVVGYHTDFKDKRKGALTTTIKFYGPTQTIGALQTEFPSFLYLKLQNYCLTYLVRDYINQTLNCVDCIKVSSFEKKQTKGFLFTLIFPEKLQLKSLRSQNPVTYRLIARSTLSNQQRLEMTLGEGVVGKSETAHFHYQKINDANDKDNSYLSVTCSSLKIQWL
ncbi:MAG: hypothetical protein NZ480_09545 [Bdellovibrionaceae bacterium]|nr:hypothetical protein [Pseudobdellovibrionaceae bacterium]